MEDEKNWKAAHVILVLSNKVCVARVRIVGLHIFSLKKREMIDGIIECSTFGLIIVKMT